MRSLEAYIDGASLGNPGPAGIGVIICSDGEVIGNISKFIGRTSNNVAEYQALIFAIQEAVLKGAENLKIFSDSQLLVRQVKGEYKVKSDGLKPLFEQVMHLKRGFKLFEIVHILRNQNRGADKLATLAIKNRDIINNCLSKGHLKHR